jgi:hypothetical protein
MFFACICLQATVEIHAAKSKAIVFCGGHIAALMQRTPSSDLSSYINAYAAEKPLDKPLKPTQWRVRLCLVMVCGGQQV